jgi:hypothetical protein
VPADVGVNIGAVTPMVAVVPVCVQQRGTQRRQLQGDG